MKSLLKFQALKFEQHFQIPSIPPNKQDKQASNKWMLWVHARKLHTRLHTVGYGQFYLSEPSLVQDTLMEESSIEKKNSLIKRSSNMYNIHLKLYTLQKGYYVLSY